MSGTILILGCGYAGCELAQRVGFGGRPVFGTTRSDQRSMVIRSRGAEPVILDTSDLSPLGRLRGRVEAIVNCIPPTMERDGSWEDPTTRIMDYVSSWDLRAFVYVSSTSVYGDHEGGRVDEHTPCEPQSPRGQARVQIERDVLGHSLPSMVVRPSGIYGPGRSQLHRLASGRLRLVNGGPYITNRIHVTDLASILEAAIDRGEPGSTYLATDQNPTPQVEVISALEERYGLPAANQLSLAEARVRMSRDVLAMVTNSKRLDPSRTLESLGVQLRYPDWSSGLAAIWRHEEAEIRALMDPTDST